MTNVTVYSYTQKFCAACVRTKKALDRLGIPYEEKSLEEQDTATMEALKAQGFMAAPVVVTDAESWSGYNPDKIEQLKELANV